MQKYNVSYWLLVKSGPTQRENVEERLIFAFLENFPEVKTINGC